MKIIQLVFTLPSADSSALFAFFKDAIPFYESTGNIHIRILRSTTNPCEFIEQVEYHSTDAFLQDQQRVEHDPEMQTYLQRWRALCSGGVSVNVFEDVTGQISQDGDEPGA